MTTIGTGAPAASTACYETLRDRIGSGELVGGTWLREVAVAAELGASRTPVREALRMLAAEGLVELVPNRGARVTSWSADDIEETYRLRGLLEGHGAALAARRSTADDIAELEAAERRYEQALGEGASAEAAAACNNAFHAAVLAAARSPRLAALLTSVWSAPLTTRAIGLYDDDDRWRSVVAHRDIIAAVRHGDDALAESAMQSHIWAARFTAGRAASGSSR